MITQTGSSEQIRRGEQEMQRGNLIGMSTEFEKTNLGDQIPDNDVRILGTTGEAHACIVEDQLCNGGFVTVERNDNGGGSRIPETNAPVVVAARITALESTPFGVGELEETYPTAKISSSVLLCVTTLTCALQEESRHLPRSSPFFTSQQRTSSLAPTMARPAPVWRAAPACSSLAQIAFDDAEATSPNVFECSNLL